MEDAYKNDEYRSLDLWEKLIPDHLNKEARTLRFMGRLAGWQTVSDD